MVHRVLWVTVLVTVVFILINTFVGGWPKTGPGSIAYPAVSVVLYGCCVGGYIVNRPHLRGPALLMVGSLGVWAVADIIDYLVPPLAKLGEAAYVGAYASTAVAVLWLVVQLRRMVGSTALVESLIGVVALSVAIGALVIYPRLLHDGAQVLAGAQFHVSMAEVGLLLLVARFWSVAALRTRAARFFMLAAAGYAAGDLLLNGVTILGAPGAHPDALAGTLQVSYAFGAAGFVDPSVHRMGDPDHDVLVTGPAQRVGVLVSGIALISATLLVDGLVTGARAWPVVLIGLVMTGALITARMYQLLSTVQRQADEMATMARVDPLTGLVNRRGWGEAVAASSATSSAAGRTRWLALLDLDHFKAYNDLRGHQAGDDLLLRCANGWALLAHHGDVVARYGGEEFVVLLEADDEQQALARTEVLRSTVPDHQTCSAGLAQWLPGEPVDAALGRADNALYHAKRLGRDRTVCAADRQPAPGR